MKQTEKNVLVFDADKGWGIINPHAGGARIGEASTVLRINNAWMPLFKEKAGENTVVVSRRDGKTIVEDCRNNGFVVRAVVEQAGKDSASAIQIEIINGTEEIVVLNSLRLFDFAPGNLFFKHPEKLKVYVDSGSGHPVCVVDMDSDGPYYDEEKKEFLADEDRDELALLLEGKTKMALHNSAGGVSLLYDSETKTALILSVLTWLRCSSNVVWCYKLNDRELSGWGSCNFAGYELMPGESIQSEKFFIGLYSDPLKALEEYADISAATMKINNLPAKTPLGWCSWYAGYGSDEIGEWNILANAKGIKRLFPAYDFKYIQVDYGWEFKNICGHWTETNERFPHGLKWLSDKIREMGYRLGIWMAPFIVLESSPLFREHPEYMVKNRDGKPKTKHKWYWLPHDNIYTLDPTHPGAREWLRNTLSTLREMGVRYWKLDFILPTSRNDGDTVYYDKKMVKGAEVYRAGLFLIEETLKGDYIYWCSNALNLGFGTGSTSMTASDIGTPGFSRCRNESADSVTLEMFRLIATTLISRYFLHNKLSVINPDVVEIRGDYEEAKIRLSLVVLSGGQTFLGDAISTCQDSQMLTKCLPAYGVAARPVDLFRNTYPESYPKIWHLHVKTTWGEWEVIGIFNLGRKTEKTKLSFAEIGLRSSEEYLVSEFWGQKFLGLKKGELTVELAPISMKLVLIKKVPQTPMVFFTDMHCTQGGVELADVSYDKTKNILSGKALRQKGGKGRITVYVPDGYECNHSASRIHDNLMHLDLIFNNNEEDWQVKFSRAGS